ncbi:MAG: GNAT family N-acetyltransferase [Butyrivibrio sp.]|nr:GNAT family N-acetyltransferase [Butyrivibrio sp.]
MNYRLGRLEDVEEISRMVDSAKELMSSQGIEQWDEIYPAKEDFEDDIKKQTLYVAIDDGTSENSDKLTDSNLAAIYVISTESDDAYNNASWEYDNACIIHRLCVAPGQQNKGIGKKLLDKIEGQLVDMGFDSVRLDVFSENPFALRLYEKNGYEKRGHADWRKGRFYLMEKKIV